MSFDIMRHKRRVKVVPTTRTTEDDYGNQVTEKGEPVEVWASRAQLTATEDIVDRDQQARTFRYFLPMNVVIDDDVFPLEIDGRSLLEDDGAELRIVGEPEVIVGTIGPHHIEAIAELIEG